MTDFGGKHVLVTGGTSGIGHAISEAFSTAGASVVAVGLACEEALPEPIETQLLDIMDPGAVARLMNGLPVLDVVVNAAGIIRRDDEFTLDVFEKVLSVNLTSVMRV